MSISWFSHPCQDRTRHPSAGRCRGQADHGEGIQEFTKGDEPDHGWSAGLWAVAKWHVAFPFLSSRSHWGGSTIASLFQGNVEKPLLWRLRHDLFVTLQESPFGTGLPLAFFNPPSPRFYRGFGGREARFNLTGRQVPRPSGSETKYSNRDPRALPRGDCLLIPKGHYCQFFIK